MKKFTKALCLVFALVLALGALAACGSKPLEVDMDEYTAKSKEVYDAQLGDFYAAYEAAKKETNVSKKYAMMAIAEAKLLESAVMVPTTTQGGNYAITKVVPRTITSVMWGNDTDRYHNALVVDKFLAKEDVAALRALWATSLTADLYEAAARAYVAEKGYTIKDNYTLAYSSDINNWDVLASSRAVDAEVLVNTYDGLYEYDIMNVAQPALATSYTVSPDGLTYTFKIRQGVIWTDSQGNKIADVKADDFVAGMQHMMDAQGGLEYLVQGIIKGSDEYITGKETDFSKVGVKATDDSTLVYTLEAPCTYFTTMLSYSVFAPLCRSYYTSKGGVFGVAALKEAQTTDAYTYAKDKDSIAYCGPYLITNATAKSTMVFELSQSYWNKDNINLKKITWLFNDGSDTKKAYEDAKAGTTDGTGLNSTAVQLAKEDGNFEKYAYVSATNSTSYMAFLNINRLAYANAGTTKVLKSKLSTKQKETAAAAFLNVHFRRALVFAFDRANYNSQSVGEELKNVSLRNSYTPGVFVSLENAVTVKINGTDKTYPAGTYYGKIMQDQLDADQVAIKVWDPTADGGVGSGDGYDGWYSAANAKAEIAKAVEELKADGIELGGKNKVYIDFPYFGDNAVSKARANSFKQSIEDALGDYVVVNTIAATQDDYYDACYYFDYGYEANYGINTLSGWGPDYGDPSTYLDTFLPNFAGYMVKSIGLY